LDAREARKNFSPREQSPAGRLATVLYAIAGQSGSLELERLSRDPAWLDKAIRIVDRLVREANGTQKRKGPEEALAA